MGSDSQTYKVKLASGRVLGPLDLERIRLLILKNQLQGTEVARIYPQGDWMDINQIPEIAELFMLKMEGKLKADTPATPSGPTHSSQQGKPTLPGATEVLSLKDLDGGAEATQVADAESATQVIDTPHPPTPDSSSSGATDGSLGSVTLEDQPKQPGDSDEFSGRNVSGEKTVLFEAGGAIGKLLKEKKAFRKKAGFRSALIIAATLLIAYEAFFDDSAPPVPKKAVPIRPQLPEYFQGKTDAELSTKIYNEGIKFYLEDTVLGYKKAAEKFRLSSSYDISNVKAVAMLASSYINLIDSSNKDENYFSVLSKLIDMSRAKAIDVPETVIADVEFFLVANKIDGAQNRIIEYTKSHPAFGLEMFYYLALTYYSRGDDSSAARYVGQLPDNKVSSAKIFYLRGLIAERLQDEDSAIKEYRKAVQFYKDHAKSHLKLALYYNKKGSLKESAPDLEFLVNHSDLLAPKDLAKSLYLHAQLAELYNDPKTAIRELERAVDLDGDNHDYLLEYYTLKAKEGGSLKNYQKTARMFYFLSEGEKLIRSGNYQEALVPLLRARQENDASPLPLVKIGDMFHYLNDVENAKTNYKLAADRAPNDIKIWSKYIQSLIVSYEWTEASLAMDRFRKLDVSQSAIDKAAADMYQRQGLFPEAQTYYRKAMSRESIDPEVYIAYGKSLMSTKNFKDAPFFFALALRYDPLNIEATLSTAKCLAETDSIDRAISMLQDELNRGTSARAEFLSAIAELQIQKGDWDQAQQNTKEAISANPNYAYPWKLLAQINMSRESTQRDALDKALDAYKSYSDRNPSDPSGYLERYKIFVRKAEFEKAKADLNRIYEIFPKYPNLHYYLGALYSIQGNHKVAADEFKAELANNTNNAQTWTAYGKELLELENPQGALDALTKAMALAPQSADAKQNAGWANFKLKNISAAVALFQAAIALDSANPLLYKRLGLIYRDIGDQASACNAFKKYLEMEPDAADKDDYRACH